MKYDMNLLGNQLCMMCLYSVFPTMCVGLLMKWFTKGGNAK